MTRYRTLTDGERSIIREMNADAAPTADDFEFCSCPRCGAEAETLKGENAALCEWCSRQEIEASLWPPLASCRNCGALVASGHAGTMCGLCAH